MKERVSIYSIPVDGPQLEVVEYQLDEARSQKISEFEAAIQTARQKQVNPESGEWGSWRYMKGPGQGSLYIATKDGIIAAWLRSGGDIGEDDIAHAHCMSLLSYWNSGLSTRLSAVYAISTANYSPGSQPESEARKYFLYDENRIGNFELSVFGSQKIGWFQMNEASKKVKELSFDFLSVPLVFPKSTFVNMLNYCRATQSVTPYHLNDVKQF